MDFSIITLSFFLYCHTDKPLHNCSLNASAIRAEVSTLKFDFNRRIKQALFASSGTAFICGAAPMIFAPSHLYFSRPWVIQQAILFWFSRMSAYFVYTCPVRSVYSFATKIAYQYQIYVTINF